jgi:hypothetical protein
MVFVGGAVISLYTDDPATDEVRPTSDIDLTIQFSGFAEWTKIQNRLAELRFYPEGKALRQVVISCTLIRRHREKQ